MRRTVDVFAAIAVSVLCVACGGSNSSGSSPAMPSAPTPTTSTTFQGVIAGSSSNQTGTLTVTVQSQVASARPWLRLPFIATLHAQSVSASGSVHIAGGSTTSLSGTFDATSRALTLSGGGFAFTGSATAGTLSGSYSAPGGAAGVFAGQSTTSGTVTSYCGNTVAQNEFDRLIPSGVFSFTVAEASGALSGSFTIFTDSPPTVGTMTGQVTGTSVTFTVRAIGGPFTGESAQLSGTIQGGTFNARDTEGRPFTGSTSRCQ